MSVSRYFPTYNTDNFSAWPSHRCTTQTLLPSHLINILSCKPTAPHGLQLQSLWRIPAAAVSQQLLMAYSCSPVENPYCSCKPTAPHGLQLQSLWRIPTAAENTTLLQYWALLEPPSLLVHCQGYLKSPQTLFLALQKFPTVSPPSSWPKEVVTVSSG